MNILVAPNSMKGSLNAFDFANTIEAALLHSGLICSIKKIPVADGGDFTGEILRQAIDAEPINLQVTGPLSDPVNATYWISGKKAIIEMAEASGMKQVKTERLNPLKATSFGTGQLILDAKDKGCNEIWLAIGGSATVDGGMGMLEALGFCFIDNNGEILKGNGENLIKINRLIKAGSHKNISFKIICDVDNPLLGGNGAAAVFGPQKGATPEMVKKLERGLKHWNEFLFRETGKYLTDIKGSGAAGGIAVPLLAFYNTAMEEGASFVLDKLNFEEHIRWADIVITGEGKIDSQTNNLKAPFVVAQLAGKHQKPVYAFTGIEEKISPNPFAAIYSLVDHSVTQKEALENTVKLLFKKVLNFSESL